MSQWISVKNKLPITISYPHASDSLVSPMLLIYSDKFGILIGCMIEYQDQAYEWYAIEIKDNLLIEDVSYWMPLPEAPDV